MRKRILWRLLKYLGSVFISFMLISWIQSSLTPTLPATNHDFTVIAHRGDHENGVPENTVAAYKQAIQHGADYVEVDLRTTRDGRFIIMHDQSVDRMTNGKGKVEDLSYAYIRSLKIQGTQNYKDKNYSVPNF